MISDELAQEAMSKSFSASRHKPGKKSCAELSGNL